MFLLDLLRTLAPDISADSKNVKVHLARYNGRDEPLDVFLRGTFDAWQSSQKSRNFERDFVVSLIQAGNATRWLFAGWFRSHGRKRRGDRYYYDLHRVSKAEEFVARLYVTSQYKHRQSYVNGETLSSDLVVSELLPERLSIEKFPGYKHLDVTHGQLAIVMRQDIDSWRSPLSHVKGIYLITDHSSGKLYVGKADGEEGFWGRWRTYSATRHGHNVALKKQFGINVPQKRLDDLRFSVLEIVGLDATTQDLDKREAHWKKILGSRSHGYNRN